MSHTAKLFMTGRSQAVRLPKELRFAGKEVIAKRLGNGVVLLPLDDSYAMLREAAGEFEPGFTLERAQPGTQPRVNRAP